MKRARWLEAKSSVSIRTIASRIKGATFAPSLSDGFLVRRVRDRVIEATYVEKLQYEEQVSDPFGNHELLNRTIYRTLDFSLSDTQPNLLLMNPSRSLQAFVSRLSEITSFTLAVSAIEVHPILWLEHLEKIADCKACIESLQVGDIDLGDGLKARVSASGSGDARKAVNELIRHRKHTVEKLVARLSLPGHEKPTKVCLVRNATAQWGSADSEFVRKLHAALADALTPV